MNDVDFGYNAECEKAGLIPDTCVLLSATPLAQEVLLTMAQVRQQIRIEGLLLQPGRQYCERRKILASHEFIC